MDLSKVVNVFRCCILTWDFLPVVLPAFLIAGAVPVFVPYAQVMRYLGYGASRVKSYLVASISGFFVSMCSCNVVPVADSIYRQGAGIGPTVTFLFAGPAINIITMAWVFQVVGLKMGLWRALAVPVCAITAGVVVHLVFRREEVARHGRLAEAAAAARPAPGAPATRRVLALFGMLLGVLFFGARGIPIAVKLPTLAMLGAGLALFVPRWFDRDDLAEWMRQTGRFLLKVLPILIPAIFALALVQNYAFAEVTPTIRRLVGHNTARDSFIAAALGSLFYFPILTEVALTKILLRDGVIAVGPALALLLNGPGVSLPGAILLVRVFGWKKTLVYEAMEILLGGTAGFLFGRLYGDYVCPCQQTDFALFTEEPTSLLAAGILAMFLGITFWRAFRRRPGLGPSAERTAPAEGGEVS